MNRLPAWLRQDLPGQAVLKRIRQLKDGGIHTVCAEARCPNRSRCLQDGHLTFLILGDTCTRRCGFCAVKKYDGADLSVDEAEPGRIAEYVERSGIRFAVITSVTRDDLADGGARQFARTVEAIRSRTPQVRIEVLIPDFRADKESLGILARARPDVIAHNIETVPRFYGALRFGADYGRSLQVLRTVKGFRPDMPTKSSLMLGLGETFEEVLEVLRDLRKNGCDILTLGQYLAPSPDQVPVKEFIEPRVFERYAEAAQELGFYAVSSAPLARSSFQAQHLFEELTSCMT